MAVGSTCSYVGPIGYSMITFIVNTLLVCSGLIITSGHRTTLLASLLTHLCKSHSN